MLATDVSIAVPLFFGFLKYALLLLLAVCLVFTVFALVSNFLGGYCKVSQSC
jgi:hypothetical protein